MNPLMNTMSSVSEGWRRLCTIASFIGCTILIIFFKHSRDSVKLSTIADIAIKSPTLANDSDANMQFVQQENFKEQLKQMKGKDKCNIFDGKWIYDSERREYNCAIQFYWSPFLMQLEMNQENGSRILRLDRVATTAKNWPRADVMVFNTGHWWDLFQYEGKTVENVKIESALEMAMNAYLGKME